MITNVHHLLYARQGMCDNVSPDCPISESFYGYAPSYPPNILLLILFGIALFAHTAQGVYYRTWGTLAAFSLGCICEVIGTSRMLSPLSRCPEWHLMSM